MRLLKLLFGCEMVIARDAFHELELADLFFDQLEEKAGRLITSDFPK